MVEKFRIDPEFRDKIPPIGEDEFKQLRENIIAEGEVYEPLVVWNGVLLDGHNRWKVIQENPTVKYRTREMHFPDKWAAFEWMYKNQLGRRNLTDEQRTYTIGKMYEARKKSITNETGRNQYTNEVVDQNDLQPKPKSTAEAIGREVGVAEPTVKRFEKFAKGVDALREVNPEAAEKVLSGNAKISKTQVRQLNEAARDDLVNAAEAIMQDKPVTANKPVPIPIQEKQEPYSIDDLVDEIIANGDDFERTLRVHIDSRISFVGGKDALPRITNAIGIVITKLEILKGDLKA